MYNNINIYLNMMRIKFYKKKKKLIISVLILYIFYISNYFEYFYYIKKFYDIYIRERIYFLHLFSYLVYYDLN